MNKLIVVGSINADHVLQVPSFPKPGETLTGHNYQVIAGGKGANQAVAAAKLGADIAFIACAGSDNFGQNIIKEFEQTGMNTEYIHNISNTPTGIAMIQVSKSGENCICLSPEANHHLDAHLINQHQQALQNCQYLLLQLETPIDGVEEAVRYAKINTKTQVILNPAPAKPLSDSLLSQIDIITPNETEAEILTGIKVIDEDSAQSAANVLHRKGITTVIITLGAQGVWLSQNSHGELIPGYQVDAVDTTAAGDTFNGAFVTGLMKDMSIPSAITYAHGAAALSVTRFGAQTSIPTQEEVDSFLANQS